MDLEFLLAPELVHPTIALILTHILHHVKPESKDRVVYKISKKSDSVNIAFSLRQCDDVMVDGGDILISTQWMMENLERIVREVYRLDSDSAQQV